MDRPRSVSLLREPILKENDDLLAALRGAAMSQLATWRSGQANNRSPPRAASPPERRFGG